MKSYISTIWGDIEKEKVLFFLKKAPTSVKMVLSIDPIYQFYL